MNSEPHHKPSFRDTHPVGPKPEPAVEPLTGFDVSTYPASLPEAVFEQGSPETRGGANFSVIATVAVASVVIISLYVLAHLLRR